MSEKEEKRALIMDNDQDHPPSYTKVVGNSLQPGPNAPLYPAEPTDGYPSAWSAPTTGSPATTNLGGYTSPTAPAYGAGYQPPTAYGGAATAATTYHPQAQQYTATPQVRSYNNNANGVIILAAVGIFLFWPLGLLALVFAIQANSYYSDGKQVEGENSAKIAKRLGIAAIVVAVVFFAFAIGFTVLFPLAVVLPATLSHR